MTLPRLLLVHLLALASLLAACADDRPPAYAERDSGPRRDAAVGTDARVDVDAAVGTDARVDVDAAEPDDAGPDAGQDPDASSPDAGAVPLGDGGCPPMDCPTPPDGCRYEAVVPCTCGFLRCDCGGVACGPTEYCEYDTPGSCMGAGTCRPRPSECPGAYDPVCGCDGATYNNACDAQRFGVTPASPGECAAVSDCRTDPCPPGFACVDCDGMFVCLTPADTC